MDTLNISPHTWKLMENIFCGFDKLSEQSNLVLCITILLFPVFLVSFGLEANRLVHRWVMCLALDLARK